MTQTEEKFCKIRKDFPEGIYFGVNNKKEQNCSVTFIMNNDINTCHLKQKLSTIMANDLEIFDLFNEIMLLAAVKIKSKTKLN